MTIDVSSGALFLALGGTLTGLIAWFLRATVRGYDEKLGDHAARLAKLEDSCHHLHTRLEVLTDRGERRPHA